MNETFYLLAYIDCTENDPLVGAHCFPSSEDARRFCYKEYVDKKWLGPKIEIFQFHKESHSWKFIGEVYHPGRIQ